MKQLPLRALAPADLPPETDLAPYADLCIETGSRHRIGDLLLIADVLVTEIFVNGWELPETMRLERDDGRSVSVYYVLDGQGYGLRPVEGP